MKTLLVMALGFMLVVPSFANDETEMTDATEVSAAPETTEASALEEAPAVTETVVSHCKGKQVEISCAHVKKAKRDYVCAKKQPNAKKIEAICKKPAKSMLLAKAKHAKKVKHIKTKKMKHGSKK